MLTGNKNLKDPTSTTDLNISVTDISFSISYTKTHKLITALYMVTDIIDKEEPIRNKLRNLGAEIVSDMHCADIGQNKSVIICTRIAETVSFLNIASAMNFISEMNCTILKKEFFELKASIQEYANMKPTWLADFFLRPHPILEESDLKKKSLENPRKQSIRHIGHNNGQQIRTRIGVQKGSTLMKALSDTQLSRANVNVFDVLKKQRQNDIINIIKIIGGNATIKDIKDKVKMTPEQASFLVSCSEKTLQRELVSMVRDGVLNKIGEKRWSKYQIKS